MTSVKLHKFAAHFTHVLAGKLHKNFGGKKSSFFVGIYDTCWKWWKFNNHSVSIECPHDQAPTLKVQKFSKHLGCLIN